MKILKKCWAITDWGGGIKNPSVSIFDSLKDAKEELKKLQALPNPIIGKNQPNKVIKVEIREI